MTNSLTTQGELTEPSLIDHIGKGREGKGRGKGRGDVALATHLQSVTRDSGNACRYAESTWFWCDHCGWCDHPTIRHRGGF